jgi:hypothetical protein
MAELARGHISDRPWGLTLGALGVRGFSGELVLLDGDRHFSIVFESGAVVDARSPLLADQAARIAFATHLISGSQQQAVINHMLADPNRDEIDLVAQVAQLPPDRADELRRRIVAQRAARTFSIESGEFFVRSAAAGGRCQVDIRPVIYLGVITHMRDRRLGDELARVGGFYKLAPEAIDDLPRYGFTDVERAIADTLVRGVELPELDAAHPDVERRTLRAVLYTLISGLACEILPHRPGAAPQAPTSVPSVTFKKRASQPAVPQRPTPSPVSTPVARADTDLQPEPDPEPPPPAPARNQHMTLRLLNFVAIPRAPAPPQKRPRTSEMDFAVPELPDDVE